MTAPELIAAVNKHGGTLRIQDGKIKCKGPESVITPNFVDALKSQKVEIMALLQGSAMSNTTLSEFTVSGRVVRIWSEVLNEAVVLAGEEADLSAVTPGEVIYCGQELSSLLGLTPALLRRLHETKKEFGGVILPD